MQARVRITDRHCRTLGIATFPARIGSKCLSQGHSVDSENESSLVLVPIWRGWQLASALDGWSDQAQKGRGIGGGRMDMHTVWAVRALLL